MATVLGMMMLSSSSTYIMTSTVHKGQLASKADHQLAQDWEALKGHPAEQLLLRYKDVVFRSQLPTIPPTRSDDIRAEIELVDDTPVARKQFRLSEEMKKAIRDWTDEMLKAGIIRPSKSPYAAPTFCVRKAVGWRVVHDFRGINVKIRLPSTPVPRKEDIFDAMRRGKMFSAMDLLWGFFQVRLRTEDIPYTAFTTPNGLFEYLVTPMGLSCSPAAFNRLIQKVFADQSSFCKAYFDDLFVYPETNHVEDHLVALEKVLERCKAEQLYVKLSKCTFCASEIPCLGDFIGSRGIRMDPDKIRVIQNWPTPRSKRELQSFLGTSVNEQLQFNEQHRKCFEELKRRLSQPPGLAHPDFDRMFCVKMDASDFAVGGYLYQLDDEGGEQIIAYGGRKHSEAELKYPTREKELLVALFAMRTWHVYLIDKPFMINTDHRILETSLQQKTCSQRLARWLNELGMYQPLFKWIKGDTNVVADFSSRNPDWKQDSTAISLAALLKHISNGNESSGVATHLERCHQPRIRTRVTNALTSAHARIREGRYGMYPRPATPPPTTTEQGEQGPSAQDPTAQGSSTQPSSAQATLTPEMLAQLLQHTLQTTQQQATQMTQLLAQTTQIQQQIVRAQTCPRPSRKKADPPRFDGSDQDDLELWIFSTEQYYSEFRTEMHEFSSNFSDMAFANLGTDAQAWYRDVKISLGASPFTWGVFKERIRARFRDKDFKYKTLTKMYELNPGKSQQEYTSRFLHLLSQVDTELPEVVKHWFFQQNLRTNTSGYISQNIPETLEKAIELAQRYEDAKPANTRPPAKEPAKQNAKTNNSSSSNSKSNKVASKDNPVKRCNYCKRKNHTEDECRTKARDVTADAESGPPKNGPARNSKRLAFHSDKLYCYLAQNARIHDRVAQCFVDSGSSFNAISPKLAHKLNVQVKQCSEPLSVKIGNNRRITIPRRQAVVTVDIEGFPEYKSPVYVMPVPENKDMLLGWPWLEQVNPDIDWTNRTISFRSDTQSSVVSFRQCLRHAPARKAGRRRLRNGHSTRDDDALQQFYIHHDFDSAQGSTRVVPAKKLKKLLREEDNEFCSVIQHDPDSSKADHQLAQDWEALKGHPAEQLLLRYKDVVFRSQLPTIPPTRSDDIRAEIELVDDTPVARKQFRLSEEMKKAIRDWTDEMLKAGIIRPSKSPYAAPTFCFWTKLLELQDTKLKPSSAFKRSTDGQTEITNRYLGDFLRAYVSPHQTDWNEFLALAELAYNSRVHDSIGMAPFVADLGYLPRSVSELAVPPRDRPRSASRFVDTRQTILTECQDALEQAQQRMKFYYDRNRPTISFQVGDEVLLDTSNLALHHVGNDGKRSLAPKYIGPYPVVKITTPDAYQIGLPPGLKLHDEFHVSRLRRYTPDDSATRDNRVPVLITRDGSLGLQVKQILKHRVRRSVDEYYIRWYGSANKDSWEPAESLVQVSGLIDAFHDREKPSRPRTRSQAAHTTTTPLS
ncbi:hypothetical protein PPTG_24175 [Phytophthora nicotianae INRA-310]|uniref:Chromo domain-containing protein n=1 Tax=Phytophthora nicotianae (strain INRA-310) TaxID=761204 RepID=W2PL03_PHYN3|nr:hypothetical protein PPTG_24175 [Phytophthora nicotianae INRA-310]ETN00919.1 hypothetical protein PPTG_24175 [Phytophthora nicotianae INRA-310]